jgi:hypothetical protein
LPSQKRAQAPVAIALFQSNRLTVRFAAGNAAKRAKIFKEGIVKAFQDPEFHAEHEKLAGDRAELITPDAMTKS